MSHVLDVVWYRGTVGEFVGVGAGRGFALGGHGGEMSVEYFRRALSWSDGISTAEVERWPNFQGLRQ